MQFFISSVNVECGARKVDKHVYDWCRKYLNCLLDANCIDQLEEEIQGVVEQFCNENKRSDHPFVSSYNRPGDDYMHGTSWMHIGRVTINMTEVKETLFD